MCFSCQCRGSKWILPLKCGKNVCNAPEGSDAPAACRWYVEEIERRSQQYRCTHPDMLHVRDASLCVMPHCAHRSLGHGLCICRRSLHDCVTVFGAVRVAAGVMQCRGMGEWCVAGGCATGGAQSTGFRHWPIPQTWADSISFSERNGEGHTASWLDSLHASV